MTAIKGKQRMPLVGVIGGDDPTGSARQIGRELMKNNCVLLTGGYPLDSSTGTSCSALVGALDAEKYGEGMARFIGVIPHALKSNVIFECLTPQQLVIHSNMDSLDRDPINGTTPDVLICLAGGPGTICELAFGIAVGREVIFHGSSAQMLLEQCKNRRPYIQRILSDVVTKWKMHLKLPSNGDDDVLFHHLTEYLERATKRALLTSAAAVVEAALNHLPSSLLDVPAFPGILDSQLNKKYQEHFAKYWIILSGAT